METLSNISKVIKSENNFCIVTHKYPDGDAIGSAYALCRILQSIGKKSKVLIDKVSEKYDFIKGYIKVEDFETKFVISVDLAEIDQLPENCLSYRNKIDLSIDHHMSNKNFAKLNFVDDKAAAASEIIYRLINVMDYDIDKKTGECLYIGISTDTGCFKYSNVTAETHKIAANLIEKGINVSRINKIFFDTKRKEFLKLESMIYGSIEYFFDGKCAVVCITQEMMENAGVLENELEGVTSIPRRVEGVEIGVTIREKSDEMYKVSVRTTEKINASEICEKFKGGGHFCAAGFSYEGNLGQLKLEILEFIEKKLKNE